MLAEAVPHACAWPKCFHRRQEREETVSALRLIFLDCGSLDVGSTQYNRVLLSRGKLTSAGDGRAVA